MYIIKPQGQPRRRKPAWEDKQETMGSGRREGGRAAATARVRTRPFRARRRVLRASDVSSFSPYKRVALLLCLVFRQCVYSTGGNAKPILFQDNVLGKNSH